MSRLRLAAATLAAALAIVLVACSGAGGANTSPVATTKVDLPRSYKFAPTEITVTAGSTVTWTNNDNFTHNVTLPDAEGAGGPLMMKPGESATHTFATPGTYAYVCSLHPKDMKGTVIVTG